MADNADTVRQFIAELGGLDAERIGAYFGVDGTYDNMHFEPIVGREAITQYFKDVMVDWTSVQSEIVHLVSEGDVVMVERVDRIGTSKGDLEEPCAGVFEMQNGKIKAWRDYFDLAEFQRQLPKA